MRCGLSSIFGKVFRRSLYTWDRSAEVANAILRCTTPAHTGTGEDVNDNRVLESSDQQQVFYWAALNRFGGVSLSGRFTPITDRLGPNTAHEQYIS